MLGDEIKELIEAALPDAQVTVKGDGDHFEAIVVSADFEGKSMVNQHRLVYGALGDRMKSEIHALALHTYTPDEWASQPRIQ